VPGKTARILSTRGKTGRTGAFRAFASSPPFVSEDCVFRLLPPRPERRLRGVHARVIEAGAASVGDTVMRLGAVHRADASMVRPSTKCRCMSVGSRALRRRKLV